VNLTYGMLEEPDTLDPYATTMSFAINVANLFYDGLTKTDDKLEIVPRLATEVPTIENGGISKDGLTITYKLRKGVKWHDGQLFTSADVKATWEWLMNPRYNPVARTGYDKIKAVDLPNDSTVVFRMSEVYAPFVATLFQYAIYPKHLLDKETDPSKPAYIRRPIGTGPYKFVSWTAGESIVAEANPDYFLGKPKINKIILQMMPDDDTMLSEFKSGKLQVWDKVPSAMAKDVESIAGVKLYKSPVMVWENYAFNHGDPAAPNTKPHPILGDVKVRKALWLCSDRTGIVKELYPDSDSDLAVTDQFPTSWAYNTSLTVVPYDPDQANKLLDEAGWKLNPKTGVREKDGKPLHLRIATTAGEVDRERKEAMLQQQWKKCGVDLEIKNYDRATYFGFYSDGGILATGQYDIAIFARSPSGSDPDDSVIWGCDNIPSKENPAGLNLSYYCNQIIDQLVHNAAKTMDQKARQEMYWRVQELLYEDAVTIFERVWVDLYAASAGLKNLKPTPTNQGLLWNVWEWEYTPTK
jgi:peptide/nickel transport system substrate-binding protein